MNRVVFHPAAQHLHSAVKLLRSADERLQFVVTRQGGQVGRKTFQGGLLRVFGFLPRLRRVLIRQIPVSAVILFGFGIIPRAAPVPVGKHFQ